MIWVLLSGDVPFLDDYLDLKDDAKKEKLINAKIEFGITWRGREITRFAKDFVKGCLTQKPEERWSSEEALKFLQDKWIPALKEKGLREAATEATPSPVLDNAFTSKMSKEQKIFDHDIFQDIMNFIDYGFLRKTVLITMAHMIDRQDIGEQLSDFFLLVDIDQTGTISPHELKSAIENMNVTNIDDCQMEKVFAGIDHDRSGEIHYAEFLAALMEGAGLVTEERLSDAFDRIDSVGKGYITCMDLKHILGKNYNKEMGTFTRTDRLVTTNLSCL